MSGSPMAPPRVRSLDVLRGAAVALMILVNNPGSWRHLYTPLAHAPWHGLTLADLVFPVFLFAAGNALAFTMPAFGSGAPGAFWRKLAQRAALIFGIGLLINASPFVHWAADGTLAANTLADLRVMGVLQRIALAWAAAAVIVRFGGMRGAAAAAAVLLLGYWAACVGLARGPDPYSLEGFFGTALDRALIGPAHLYGGEGVPFDPEGLASTLPAVAQVLLGFLVGAAVGKRPGAGTVRRLAGAAVGLLLLALAWQTVMPLNKKLWTSSYVLLTTGLSFALLAALVHTVDLRGAQGRVVRFFEVYGKNALFVFVLSSFVPRVIGLLKGPPRMPADAAGPAAAAAQAWIVDPRLLSLAAALAQVAFYAAIAWALDRRRIYIRV
jgi:predicted acyltransferase